MALQYRVSSGGGGEGRHRGNFPQSAQHLPDPPKQLTHSNPICKKWPHNYLEAFFHLQLVIFAASMFYARCNHGNMMAAAYASIGMSLVVFLAVIGYRICCRMASFKKARTHKGYANFVKEDMKSFIHERVK